MASACASAADHLRLCHHHDFSLWRDCRSRPAVQPPRPRPAPSLLITTVRTTTTTLACAATADHGRLGNRRDVGLRPDCSSRPPAQPPRLRPVPRLPIAAVRSTTTTLAGWRRPEQGRERAESTRRKRSTNRTTRTTSAGWGRARLAARRLAEDGQTSQPSATTTSTSVGTAHRGCLPNHHDFGWRGEVERHTTRHTTTTSGGWWRRTRLRHDWEHADRRSSRRTTTTSAGWGRPSGTAYGPTTTASACARLPIAAVVPTTRTLVCATTAESHRPPRLRPAAFTAHQGRPQNHYGFDQSASACSGRPRDNHDFG